MAWFITQASTFHYSVLAFWEIIPTSRFVSLIFFINPTIFKLVGSCRDSDRLPDDLMLLQRNHHAISMQNPGQLRRY